MEQQEYRQCAISVMDNIADPNITFDEKGICNYYYRYKWEEEQFVFKGAEGERLLKGIAEKIKAGGKGKKYDCITGVSGGVDSTYVALKAKELGLNPLIVHFDNGWNSELAVKNIENIVSKLGFDLYTLVVDWNEFRDIQKAFIKASVVDIETITDHAIIGTLYKLALKHNIKYILSGSNVVTEAVLPEYWIFSKSDHVNIQNIHKKFGTVPLKTYPLFDTVLKKRSQLAGITTINILNYLPYNKAEVKRTIQEKLDWKDYGGKHYESIFTRFYQGYILPEKFKIDKRKAHLSNLVFSGQITKAQALAELEQPIYPPELLKSDKEFVLKKLEIDPAEFEALMKAPRIEHSVYGTEKGLQQRFFFLKPLIWTYRKLSKLRNRQ
jgi:N-acetyl sugar amidotransferase